MQSRLSRALVTAVVALGLILSASGCGRNLSAAEKIAIAIAHGFGGSVGGYELCKQQLGDTCR